MSITGKIDLAPSSLELLEELEVVEEVERVEESEGRLLRNAFLILLVLESVFPFPLLVVFERRPEVCREREGEGEGGRSRVSGNGSI